MQRSIALLHRHDEAVHDVIFAFGRVLAHVEIEDRAGLGARGIFHEVAVRQHHFLADELLEFFRADFTQAFEPRYLRLAAQFLDRRIALGFAVAIDRLGLVAHAEQWRLEDVNVAVVDQLLEELEEVGDHQVADVQAVHVRVGGEDDLVVAQALGVVLDVERLHEVVHLVVLVHHVALEIPDVERLALEHEHGLIVHVAATRDRAGGGLAFADEDHRAPALFLLLIEMILAVLQLRDAQRDGLRAFARELLHVLQFLPQPLRVRHLRKDVFGETAFARTAC